MQYEKCVRVDNIVTGKSRRIQGIRQTHAESFYLSRVTFDSE